MAFRNRRIQWFVVILVCILLFAGYWSHRRNMHSTPETALNNDRHVGGIVEQIPFAKGVVVIAHDDADILGAYYMKDGFWGWKIYRQIYASLSLGTYNYNVDFEPFAVDGETFVWGTCMVPIKEIIDHHNGNTYTWQSPKTGQSVVWHIILPYEQTLFVHSEWSMVRDNGTTGPLFK